MNKNKGKFRRKIIMRGAYFYGENSFVLCSTFTVLETCILNPLN